MAILELFAIGFVLLFVILLLTVGYVIYCQGGWERCGVYTVQTGSKFFGHFAGMILKTRAFPYVIQVYSLILNFYCYNINSVI
jgi:hypothetical protein